MRDFFSFPALIDIDLTQKCNLGCEFCSISAGENCNDNDELKVNEYKVLFDELHENHVHRISLGGGEPFLRKDFFDILDLLQNYNFSKVINSNGTLIDNIVAKELKQYQFDRICISLDGSTADKHDAIRGKGNFFKTLDGIQNLQKYNLPVSTLFTLYEKNVDDLIPTIKLNENLNIQYMTVMIVCPTGRAALNKMILTKEKWYPVFNKLTDMLYNKEINLKFKIVPPNESDIFWLFYFPLEYYNRLDLLNIWKQYLDKADKSRRISCKAGITTCSINYNGDVYGCSLMTSIDYFKAGNIRKNTLKFIWQNSEIFKKLRNLEFKDINGSCSKCNLKWCGGGCRSSAYNLTSSIYGSDETCFYNMEGNK